MRILKVSDELFYDMIDLLQCIVDSDDPIVDNNTAGEFLRELEEVD